MTVPRPLSVLVVDDMADAADSMALLLGLRGFRVRTAAGGPEALAAAAADRPDVVLTEVEMPGMTGWELADRLRALYPQSTPEVVAVTGWQRRDDCSRSAAAGIRLHLLKPADPETLVAYLEGLSTAGDH